MALYVMDVHAEKMTNSPFSHTLGSEVKTSRPRKIVHTDPLGFMSPNIKGGALYVLTLIDDSSRFIYLYLRFEAFRDVVDTLTDCKIKCIHSDNGGEYTYHQFNKYCADLGIIHQRSVPYNPQQNGLAERTNRTLVEMARLMIFHMEVDRS
ncbi:hypothetical protein DD238_004037 [Peronospora effusa]|uniref:Integrase catalytic domain-containing protein n=1 Tax=Peronospora effusa TaxID=542832 RepID=A0A3M6VLJ2_9STRA|nr:hypothetical protein DD238_004037 [Peronospora effusa]